MTQYYHIKTRRDTAARWAQNNPTPADGEMCIETDTKLKKIGNGTTPYNSLPYDQPSNATASKAGLMSPADKQKLDGINLALYAKLQSPNFTGTPKAPKQNGYDVSLTLATNSYVLDKIASFANGLMVRCIFNIPSDGDYRVLGDVSNLLFIGVNGEACPLDAEQKLVSGINYIDCLFGNGAIMGSRVPAAAFMGINLLTTVILPERMLAILDGAFNDCSELKDVYCLSPTPPTLEGRVFRGTPFEGGEKLYVHKVYEATYRSSQWASVGCTIETL
jgi:hypothetical protein